jgi:hypothetical protein
MRLVNDPLPVLVKTVGIYAGFSMPRGKPPNFNGLNGGDRSWSGKAETRYARFKLLHLQRCPYSRYLRRGWRPSSILAGPIADATTAKDSSVAVAASAQRDESAGFGTAVTLRIRYRCCGVISATRGRRLADLSSAKLDPSVGRSDHTISPHA